MKAGSLIFLICAATVANGLPISTSSSIGAPQDSLVPNLRFLSRKNATLPKINCPKEESEIVCPDPVPEPGKPTWSPWGPCMGECGYQTHSRTCIGTGGEIASCKGTFIEKCVDVKKCCTYQSTEPPSKGPAALVPFYSAAKTNKAGRCASKAWKTLAKGCGATLAIINPNNGPYVYKKQQTDFAVCMDYASVHGVKFVGYIYTKSTDFDPVTGIFTQTGLRNYDLIKKDIDEWYRVFGNIKGFTGIFIDEASSAYQANTKAWNVDHIAFYQKIVNYIRSKAADALIVYNSGGTPPAEMWKTSVTFPDPVNVTVINEIPVGAMYPAVGCLNHLWTKEKGTFGHGSLCPMVVSQYVPDGDQIEPFLSAMSRRETAGATLVFDAREKQAYKSLEDATKHNIRYHYVSHRTLANNPWGSLATYWNNYMQKLNKLRVPVRVPS